MHTVKEIERIECPDSPFDFYRNYVAQNKPVIITGRRLHFFLGVSTVCLPIATGAVDHWPAFHKWNNAYFRKTLGETTVTVDVTPNGYGDAIVNDTHFVKPDEQQLTINKFFDCIEDKEKESVYYIQHQNSNLTDEFSTLIGDVDGSIEWVSLENSRNFLK